MALSNALKKGSIKAIGRPPGGDLYEEMGALFWRSSRFTDKQGAKAGSTEFEDIQFLADEIRQEWPEASRGLLAEYISERDEQSPSSLAEQVHDEAKPSRSKYENWELRQSTLVKQGMNLRDAAAEIASDVGVDPMYVERETRRVRREREKSGTESGEN